MGDLGGWILLLGRVLVGGYFAGVSGMFHLRKGQMAVGYARQMAFPLPALAAWPSAIWLLVSGLSILLGVWPDIGSLMIACFVIPAAWWFHRFWVIEDENQKQVATLLFGRNVVFLGASLMLFAFFAAFGDDLPLMVTGPLFDLSD
jgi:putative oxidoreductase